MGGGGVDGAIHRAGGPAIGEECKQVRARQGRLPTGEAVITTGGRLKARYVIHTVGPIWSDGQSGEPEALRNAYRNSLSVAAEKGVRSISFPSISTGAYRFPIDTAARIALATVRDFLQEHDFDEVRFVLFSAGDQAVYEAAWEEVARECRTNNLMRRGRNRIPTPSPRPSPVPAPEIKRRVP